MRLANCARPVELEAVRRADLEAPLLDVERGRRQRLDPGRVLLRRQLGAQLVDAGAPEPGPSSSSQTTRAVRAVLRRRFDHHVAASRSGRPSLRRSRSRSSSDAGPGAARRRTLGDLPSLLEPETRAPTVRTKSRGERVAVVPVLAPLLGSDRPARRGPRRRPEPVRTPRFAGSRSSPRRLFLVSSRAWLRSRWMFRSVSRLQRCSFVSLLRDARGGPTP